jgi:hypothetical protein
MWGKEELELLTLMAVLVRRVVEARRLTAGDGPANRTAALPLQSNPNRDRNDFAAHTQNEKDGEDEPKQSFWRRLKCW